MSKAFIRESDDTGAQEVPSFRPQLPPGARNYITHEGAGQLKHRLKELFEKRSTWAGRSGDAAPTADPNQRRTESAIREIQSILDSVIVAEIPADQEKVAFGAFVTIRHENGVEEAYQIVGVDETDPSCGRISWVSPLARALFCGKAGVQVHFRSPAGTEELTILEVHYHSRDDSCTR